MTGLKRIESHNGKGLQMFTIVKKTLSALLLVFVAAGPMACLNINSPPENKPGTEVNVGGDRGVTVDHK
jgi:hypothetical protein